MIKFYGCQILNYFFGVTLLQFASSYCRNIFVFWWHHCLLVNNGWSCLVPRKPIYFIRAWKDFLSITLTCCLASFYPPPPVLNFSFFIYSSSNINILYLALNLFNSLITSRTGFLLFTHDIFLIFRCSFSISLFFLFLGSRNYF